MYRGALGDGAVSGDGRGDVRGYGGGVAERHSQGCGGRRRSWVWRSWCGRWRQTVEVVWWVEMI